MKNVLVLGANGFIGRHLINNLMLKANVVGYDRMLPNNHVTYPFIQGDFSVEEKFEELLSSFQIDTIYHLISSTVPCVGTTHAALEIEENVMPTVKLLEAMKNAGTKRIVFSSSGGTVYGELRGYPHKTTDPVKPICSYGLQKVIIEQYLDLYGQLYDMRCIVARISNPYGVLSLQNRKQGVIPILLSKLFLRESITIYGETVRDYIHISDVVESLTLLGKYEKEKRIFNIATGTSTSLQALLQMLEAIAECKFVEIVRQDIRDCDVWENALDISDTIRELNWCPKVALEEGIKHTFFEMKKHNFI